MNQRLKIFLIKSKKKNYLIAAPSDEDAMKILIKSSSGYLDVKESSSVIVEEKSSIDGLKVSGYGFSSGYRIVGFSQRDKDMFVHYNGDYNTRGTSNIACVPLLLESP